MLDDAELRTVVWVCVCVMVMLVFQCSACACDSVRDDIFRKSFFFLSRFTRQPSLALTRKKFKKVTFRISNIEPVFELSLKITGPLYLWDRLENVQAGTSIDFHPHTQARTRFFLPACPTEWNPNVCNTSTCQKLNLHRGTTFIMFSSTKFQFV
jgi:hypothetical protein